ncbi:MAG TPA: hypothetical protein VKB47_08605 [Terracidiphilus sp.]|nr:hypothetical protein [Terracidiphilus sp.]
MSVSEVRDLVGLDMLCNAMDHLAAQFDVSWPRELAAANLDARALLFNAAQSIFREYGVPITRAEVEGAR